MSLVRVGRCCVELHCGTVLGGGDLAHFPGLDTLCLLHNAILYATLYYI